MSSPIVDTLRGLASALEGVGEGWYLFGAQAALLRGSRRLTSDVDVTILPGNVSTADLLSRLTANRFSLRVDDVDGFVARTRVLPLVHEPTRMPVDVALGGPGLERHFLEASEVLDLEGVRVPVATADHLVVMKLLAGRSKDLDDATAIAQAGGVDLDAVAELVTRIAEGLGEGDIRHALESLRRRLASG